MSIDESRPVKHSRLIAASPIYYGWVVLMAGTIGMLMTTPGQTVGVSVFLDKIINELNISRSAVALLYMVGTLGGSFSLPFIGRLIDRKGPRYGVIAIAFFFALACVGMGFVQGLFTLGLGFIAIRGLGQGALGLVSINVINLWFVRRRGLAISLSGIGFALGVAIFPLLIEFLIAQFGWRLAYMILGGVVAVTILPIGAAIYREQPERYGLQPDGKVISTQNQLPEEVNYTLAAARRTFTFWLFAAGSFCVAALGTGLIFHHYSIMATAGLERAIAAVVFIPFGFVTASANFVTGILMDRVSPRLLLSAMLMLLSAALFMSVRVTGAESMLAYGCLLGLMQGMSSVIQAGVYAYYFGRSHLGAISGLATTISVAGTAFGPVLFATGFERFGSYAPILGFSMTLPLAIAFTSLWVELTRRIDSTV
ncbi:MAG: MFS transporter [Trichormus sp. ATA11-4-KO1]|nr:MFS transporter [Trichormus sp. ATA11-4-KO1]